MRITGGIYKGRKIICPKGIIRPAMDRMRESLFAILGDLQGLTFLDLHAGSGVVGIEAASRGANPVIFVEKDYERKKILQRNCAFVTSDIEIYMMPVFRFIQRQKRNFDIIFLDPPFNLKGKEEVVQRIESLKLLSEKGMLIIHIPKEEIFPDRAGRLEQVDMKKYGSSVLLFFKWRENCNAGIDS